MIGNMFYTYLYKFKYVCDITPETDEWEYY